MATYGLKQPPQTIHLLQNNTREVCRDNFLCLAQSNSRFPQSMSPGSVTGMSPSYVNRLPRPSSDSPPLTGTQNLTTHIGSKTKPGFPLSKNFDSNVRYLSTSDNTPQTLMGQFIHLLQNNAREVSQSDYRDCGWNYNKLFLFSPSNQTTLNNQTNLDDLSLNLESFQGGLDCNVEEVRRLIISR
jgi:forkhead box protein O3